jgi:hypothetical protein
MSLGAGVSDSSKTNGANGLTCVKHYRFRHQNGALWCSGMTGQNEWKVNDQGVGEALTLGEAVCSRMRMRLRNKRALASVGGWLDPSCLYTPESLEKRLQRPCISSFVYGSTSLGSSCREQCLSGHLLALPWP